MAGTSYQVSARKRARLVKEAVRLLDSGVIAVEVAKRIGVARSTFYQWASSEPALAVALAAPDDFGHRDCRAVLAREGPAVLEALAHIARNSPDEANRIKAAAVLAPMLVDRSGGDAAPLQLEVRLAPAARVVEGELVTPAALGSGDHDGDDPEGDGA